MDLSIVPCLNDWLIDFKHGQRRAYSGEFCKHLWFKNSDLMREGEPLKGLKSSSRWYIEKNQMDTTRVDQYVYSRNLISWFLFAIYPTTNHRP